MAPALLMAVATLPVPPGRLPSPVIVPFRQTKACMRLLESSDQPTASLRSLSPSATLRVPPRVPRFTTSYSTAAGAAGAIRAQSNKAGSRRWIFMGIPVRGNVPDCALKSMPALVHSQAEETPVRRERGRRHHGRRGGQVGDEHKTFHEVG